MAGELVRSQQEGAEQLTRILTDSQEQQTRTMRAAIQAVALSPQAPPVINVPAPVVTVVQEPKPPVRKTIRLIKGEDGQMYGEVTEEVAVGGDPKRVVRRTPRR